jgi:hypothetical protein
MLSLAEMVSQPYFALGMHSESSCLQQELGLGRELIYHQRGMSPKAASTRACSLVIAAIQLF